MYSKEVQAEQEPTRENFEVESVTHHDYRKELAQAGPPAPTKVRTHPTPLVQLGSDGLGKVADPQIERGSFRPRGIQSLSLTAS